MSSLPLGLSLVFTNVPWNKTQRKCDWELFQVGKLILKGIISENLPNEFLKIKQQLSPGFSKQIFLVKEDQGLDPPQVRMIIRSCKMKKFKFHHLNMIKKDTSYSSQRIQIMSASLTAQSQGPLACRNREPMHSNWR